MVSLYRLKGRALQIDNALIMVLAFFSGLCLIITAGLFPILYERVILPYCDFTDDTVLCGINLFSAFIFLLSAFGFYSSVRLGIKRYLLKKAQKKKPSSGDIFFYFKPKKYFSSLFYSSAIFMIKLSILVFCLIPSAVCLFTVDRFSRQGVSALVCLSLTVTAVFLGINGCYFYSVFNSSFFLCDYFFIDGSYLSFRHLIACSQRGMNGKNILLTRLKMSFVGWFVLCLLILPVPYVWGYYNQSLAVAAAEFMKGKGR